MGHQIWLASENFQRPMGAGTEPGELEDHLKSHTCNMDTMKTADNLTITDTHIPKWNTNVVRSLWPNGLADTILQILTRGADIRYWGSEPAGRCTAKALYKKITGFTAGPYLPWKIIRSLEVPLKVQMFIWKLLLGRLPVREPLNRNSGQIPSTCVLCNVENESVNHLVTHYPVTASIWNKLPRNIIKPHAHNSFANWFWHVATKHNKRVGALISWYIWKMRNEYIFQSIPIHPTFLPVKTKLAIFEWNTAHLFPLTANLLGLPSAPWIAPPQGFCKLNFDGVVNVANQTAGVGGIIRDHHGEMVAAYTGAIAVTHPRHDELQSLMHGIIVCNSKSPKNIIMEGDCLGLVENLRNLDNIKWDYMPLGHFDKMGHQLP